MDWDRAVSTGSYTTGSLDGVIACTTAARHAAVANARFAGRTDLVLLLLDGDRLASQVRLGQADAGGQLFPRIHGQVPLEAVFEAVLYRPGTDGWFHLYEEASGFATHSPALDRLLRAAHVASVARHPSRAALSTSP